MQNEFKKRFCWGVLITYSSIVFFGQLIHAIPGMECHDGCVSGHEYTSRNLDTCSSQLFPLSTKSISSSKQLPNPAHCVFCKRRNQKPTATECSAAIGTSPVAQSKNRIELSEPLEPCPVCKLIAGFSSSLPQYSETDFGSELVSSALLGANRLPVTFSVQYSPRGPPRDVIL